MADAPIQYQRLPGSGVRRDGNALITARRMTSRLYLGPNHLLSAERSWCYETYKRFDFRDIQALIVRRTSKATITTIILGALTALFLLLALLVNTSSITFAVRSARTIAS